jgi:probable rRNA maturation factor
MATPVSFPLSERPLARDAGAITLNVDILVAAEQWRARANPARVIRAALDAAAAFVSSLPPSSRPADSPCRGEATLAVALVDDVAIRRLNRDFRGIDKSTNVLAFPAAPNPAVPDAPRPLGDVAIAYGVTAREAEAAGKPFDHHLSHLAVHGFLHLLGYDHDQDDEADEMERLERAVLAKLTIPDPYTAPIKTSKR